jgi:hypothetical protein
MVSQKTLSKRGVLAALIVIAGTVVAALLGRFPAASAFATQKKTTESNVENKMPLAVYSAELPTEPAERAIRVARSGRFDKRYPVPFDELSPDTEGRSSISDWYVYMSALPATESDAIVVGEVTSTNGYLSNDRTGAYSEFTVRIYDVFKGTDILSGTSLTAVREGADVQLPSGRIIKYYILHQGIPVAGRRYVFFLKYNEQGKDFTILTAYELRKSGVLPLDEVEPFIVYSKREEGEFLNLVREAIAPKPAKNS